MSFAYTKLYSQILQSTIWCEPDGTRLVWLTMLALADHAGRVHASIPGLASTARVPLTAAQAAIETFLAPDPYSRDKSNDGRRIEEIEGGWRLLNYTRYRELKDEESIRASKAAYMRRKRAEERAAKPRPIHIHTESVEVHSKGNGGNKVE